MDNQLQECIITREASKFYVTKVHSVYQDDKGYWSIDPGICLDKRLGCGLTTEECLYLLNNRVNIAQEVLRKYSWYVVQDITRQGCLTELYFSMGLGGLLEFSEPGGMLDLMCHKRYEEAAQHLLESKWAKDVKAGRAQEVANRIKTGHY